MYIPNIEADIWAGDFSLWQTGESGTLEVWRHAEPDRLPSLVVVVPPACTTLREKRIPTSHVGEKTHATRADTQTSKAYKLRHHTVLVQKV